MGNLKHYLRIRHRMMLEAHFSRVHSSKESFGSIPAVSKGASGRSMTTLHPSFRWGSAPTSKTSKTTCDFQGRKSMARTSASGLARLYRGIRVKVWQHFRREAPPQSSNL